MELNLVLPVPTSINDLYINEYGWSYNTKTKKKENKPTGRRILSKKGRKVKNQIKAETRVQMQGQDWDYEYTKENYLYLDTVIYFNRKGRDDNNIYKLLNDTLEGICFENDSRVLVRTQKILYDTQNPRVEIKIHPVEYIGIFDSQQELDQFENKCQSCSRYLKGRCSILQDGKEARVRKEVDLDSKTCISYKEKKTK